jgi:hypothetical protein
MDKLIQSIDSIPIVKRDNIKNDDYSCEKISVTTNDSNVVDAMIILHNIIPTSSGFECLKCDKCIPSLDYQDIFRSQLKAFRNQFGSIGVNVNKTRCSYVIELGKMITGVRGVEKVMKPADVAKVNMDSIKMIKNTIKQLNSK